MYTVIIADVRQLVKTFFVLGLYLNSIIYVRKSVISISVISIFEITEISTTDAVGCRILLNFIEIFLLVLLDGQMTNGI